MPPVTVAPSGVRFEAEDGELLMRAANRAEVFWPTICGGEGRCGACCVAAPASGLAPPSDFETGALAKLGRAAESHRLACQAAGATGPRALTMPRVRAARPGDRLPYA